MAGQNSAELLVTRAMRVLYAPYAVDNDLPADTVLYNDDWMTPWIDAGFTDGGVSYTIDLTRETINVDQVLDPVLRPVSARDIHFDTKLAQTNATFVKVASGMGSIDTVAASSTLRGHDDFVLDASVPGDVFYSLAFELEQQNGEAFRAIIYKGIPTSSPNPTYGVANTLSSYDLVMTAVPGDATATHPLALLRSITPITA